MEIEELSPRFRVAVIIALVFGVLGVGWAALQLIQLTVSGVLLGGAMGLNVAAGQGSPTLHTLQLAQLVTQGLQHALGLIVSVGIVGASIAALGRRPRPLVTIAMVCVLLNVLFGALINPGLSIIGMWVTWSEVQALTSAGQLEANMLAMLVTFGAVGVIWSLVWTAFKAIFWLWVHREGRAALQGAMAGEADAWPEPR